MVVVRLVREWMLWNGCMHFDITVTLAYTKYKKGIEEAFAIYLSMPYQNSRMFALHECWLIIINISLCPRPLFYRNRYRITIKWGHGLVV